MCKHQRSCRSLVLSLFLVVIAASGACAQSSLKNIDNRDGSKIFYGLVDGATSPAAAMAQILRNVQKTSGEKPQVGRVFRVRGSNSDAVFVTVVNHSMGNKQRAGLLIAASTGPNHMEIGFVLDDAARFNSSMNSLLKTLFSVWHPGGTAAPAGKASAGGGGALPHAPGYPA